MCGRFGHREWKTYQEVVPDHGPFYTESRFEYELWIMNAWNRQ